MIHFDARAGIISYFRPALIHVVNKVFDRNFKKYNIFQGLFSIPLDRFSGWSFSFGVLITAYIIMLAGGYALGTYVDSGLLIVIALPLTYLMIHNVALASAWHAVVLGAIIGLMSGQLEFIIPAMVLFLAGRLAIDIPHLRITLNFKRTHEKVLVISGYGFEHPLKADDHFLETVYDLYYGGMQSKRIMRAYVYGHHLSKNEDVSSEEVIQFIKEVLEGMND